MSLFIEIVLTVTAWSILLVGLCQNLIYAGYIYPAWRELRRRANVYDAEASREALRSGDQPSVTLIVPAYNEARSIVDNAHSLLSLHYSNFELIIANDGSGDDTMARLRDALELQPSKRALNPELKHAPVRAVYRSAIYSNLLVLDKENGGKADSINAGLACTRTELFCVIDADSILEAEALTRATRPFDAVSEHVVAVGGTVGIANGCTITHGQIERYDLPARFLPRAQVVEYTRAFLMARLASSRTNTLALISGAFGVFRTREVVEIGGYDAGTVGEDMELVVRLHRHLKALKRDYTMRYLPEPVCWTEVPSTLRALSRQRIRWQRGALETLSRHKGMIFNPRYGRFGMLALPSMVLIDVIGPVIEVLGYIAMPVMWWLGIINAPFFFAYLALTFVFGIFLSTTSLMLEQGSLERPTRAVHIFKLAWTATLENFGYRQLNNIWRFIGLVRHLRSAPSKWGDMERKGFSRG